ncbi:MAG: nicotinate-nucleotide--dimethylbenzimidazole phosphoribosyltransferase [Acidaminococcaceae bacterium]|nr:nicotinate-nucleotide--dimethylbenzimidazole phosphoribosyltransferase [Acidaminococcaceae bacterium]
MNINEIIEQITPIDEECCRIAQKRFDDLIKPVGSLAKLEEMTSRYAGIIGKTNKNDIDYPKRKMLIWGSIVNTQEAEKIMNGSLPINVLAAETGAEAIPLLVLSEDEEAAMLEGAMLVNEYVKKEGLGLLGYGCLQDDKLVLAAMAGGILQAAALKVGVMLDGVATCRAAQLASKLAPEVVKYCFAGHVSAEEGAEEALASLGLSAPLRLNISCGTGEGAAVAMTLFNAGIKAYKEMETFAEAGVHVEVKEFSLAEQIKGK